MADYTYSQRTTVTHEWLVPAGAAIAEFYKAVAAATRQYESIHGTKPDFDHWARVYPDDDGIYIRFEEVSRG